MRDDFPYADWKKEVKIWCTFTELDKKKQGGALFLSLKGKARETVLAGIADIDTEFAKDDIVDKIIKCLDSLYLKDTTESAFEAFDSFIKFRRPKDMSIQKYLVEFNLKNKKLVTHKMTLPDGVLAYALLTCANLSKEQTQLCRATCDTLKFDTMKKQIEKIAESMDIKVAPDAEKIVPQETFVSHNEYVEQNTYHASPVYDPQYDEAASWEDFCEEPENDSLDPNNEGAVTAFYGSQAQRPFGRGYNSRGWFPPRGRGFSSRTAPNQHSMNPLDEMGQAMTCRFCKSTYHLLRECPHAPSHMKEAYRPYARGRGGYRGNSHRGRGGGGSTPF